MSNILKASREPEEAYKARSVIASQSSLLAVPSYGQHAHGSLPRQKVNYSVLLQHTVCVTRDKQHETQKCIVHCAFIIMHLKIHEDIQLPVPVLALVKHE